MAAADDANITVQANANILDNLQPKKQLGILKASAGGSLSELKVVLYSKMNHFHKNLEHIYNILNINESHASKGK